MPVIPSYPGVYIEEIPSGVRTITSIATSITAFIGRALRGPVNEPILINNYGDFERIFGGLWVDSTLGYAVRDFYLNGGSQAVIVRLYHPEFSTPGDETTARKAAQDVANQAGQKADEKFNEAIKNTAANEVKTPFVSEINKLNNRDEEIQIVATAAKKAKDLQLQTESSSNTDTDLVKIVKKWAINFVEEIIKEVAQKPHANKTSVVTELEAAFTNNWNSQACQDRALINIIAGLVDEVKKEARAKADTYKSNAVESRATQEVVEAINSIPYNATVNQIKDIASNAAKTVAPITKAILKLNNITLEAAYPGSWGNALQAQIDYNTRNTNDSSLFNLSVKLGEGEEFEIFRNVSMTANHSSNLQKILESSSKLVRVKSPPESNGPVEAKKDGSLVWVKVEIADKAGDGGKLEVSDFNGNDKEARKQGLYALEKTDLFSLLCIPPYKRDGAGLDVDSGLIDSAIAYCKKRRALLIIDAPSDWIDKETAKKGIKDKVGATSENAALFFPRLKQPNPLKNNQIEVFAACGAVAGVFSRTDSQRGIWKAPAGLEATLVGVPELSVPLTDAEIGELNPLGINCLRTVPAAGRVIWGSRTRVGDDRLTSEWKYISVRRLALYIQENLYRGTQWVVFEPNDEPLWAQIRLNLGAFMNNLFRQGAFQGNSPKEAYFVKCDKETTTQDDINRGIVNIVVGFAPLKPAEFVVIKFQQMAGQVAG